MRVRSAVLMAAFAAAAVVTTVFTAGCNRTGNGSGTPSPVAGKTDYDPNVDVGAPLYKPADPVKITAGPLAASDPLVLANCLAQFEDRQQVSSEVEGRIELLAARDDEIDAKNPKLVYHPRDLNKQVKYRLLKEGDPVKAGQEFCFLNDELVTAKMEAAKTTRDANLEVEKQAASGVELTKKKAEISKRAWEVDKTGSFADYLQDAITLTRFEENRANARATIAKAEAEFKEAQVMLRKHRLVSSVNGIIRNVVHRAGNVVKAGEKILEIQATDTIRLEGTLESQYAQFLRRGMPVTVEPAIPSAPYKTYPSHRSEVTGLAVTATPGRPLVVSTSAEGSARVWDVTKNAVPHHLPHPVPVRAVACSPAGARAVLAVTGADDGKVRVWDLSNPDRLPVEPRELAETHGAAVGAVAFSPDGRFLATAAGRDVFVWDAADGRKLYVLPAEHRDAVTCLQFTPQGTLVTASNDRSLKVWKLGADRAAVAKSLEPRAGVVDVLGVTHDGGRVVFDQDKSRLDLVSLADKQTYGQIQNTGTTASFSTLAIFNRDDTLLLTAGGEGELKGGLQIWTVPTSGRGAEVARLFTPNRVGVTAAAFSPSKENPFLVVGTEKGTVHVWLPPSEAARKPYPGTLVNWDSSDPRYVTVRVEMDNRELNLMDRSTATVIITPDGK